MFPFASIDIPTAAGTAGSPGILNISPAIGIMKPAPAAISISLIVISKPSIAPKIFGLSVNEY